MRSTRLFAIWQARVAITIWLLGLVLSIPSFASGPDPLARFYGHYVGKATDGSSDVKAMRNTEVIIKPAGEGFNLQWTTIIHRQKRKVERKFSINFVPRASRKVYASAMKIDTFGHRVPLDPLKGDPFLWAVVSGNTLTVHSLLIFDDGGYELQSYERRRSKPGLDLIYRRIRNGMILKVIQGKLLKK